MERLQSAAIALNKCVAVDIPACDIGLDVGFEEGFSKLASILDMHDGEVEMLRLEDEENLVLLEQEHQDLKRQLENVNDIIRNGISTSAADEEVLKQRLLEALNNDGLSLVPSISNRW